MTNLLYEFTVTDVYNRHINMIWHCARHSAIEQEDWESQSSGGEIYWPPYIMKLVSVLWLNETVYHFQIIATHGSKENGT